MKQFKSLVALALVAMLIVVMAMSAHAATITINRDSSWNASGTPANATYNYYKIFDAAITSSGTTVVYTTTDATIAGLVNATGVLRADLASDSKYYISKSGTQTTDDAILAAVQNMVNNNKAAFTTSGTTTSAANPVTITVTDNGYYFIEASNGKDVIVQTLGDVTITEKNDYPTVDKKQSETSGTSYEDALVSIGVGSYIYYQVTVHVPTDATKQIAVIDKMSAGLEYDSATGLSLSPAATYADLTSEDAGYDSSITSTNGWQIKFAPTVVESYRGQDIVITYRAKITAAAVTDTGKENEVTLNYDNNNYILKDKVDYETKYVGLYKYDGADSSIALNGVTFKLYKDGVEFPVTKTGNYYYPDASGTSTVTTDANGMIIIRGLDGDTGINYKVIEQSTNEGYNVLTGDINLTNLHDDKADANSVSTSGTNTSWWNQVANNKGAVLPSTGGIGTTIIYIVGAVLVLGAAAIIIARRKAEQE